MERLDKFLALQGRLSRKEACERIRAGEVRVNGKAVLKKDYKLNPEADEVFLQGERLNYRKFVYLMMNKPSGVLSASRDSSAETVVELVPEKWKRRGLFPAGRLDKDTEGLLLLTDDGDFAHRMLSPKSGVYKLYEAVLDLPAEEADVSAFREGLCLSDGTRCLPAGLFLPPEGEKNRARVLICEGKFHQVKKMFFARGKTVLHLKRLRIGKLRLDEALSPGECRELSEGELELIFERSNLPKTGQKLWVL